MGYARASFNRYPVVREASLCLPASPPVHTDGLAWSYQVTGRGCHTWAMQAALVAKSTMRKESSPMYAIDIPNVAMYLCTIHQLEQSKLLELVRPEK